MGPNEIHPRILKKKKKNLAVELGPLFAHLFQQSLDTSEISEESSMYYVLK